MSEVTEAQLQGRCAYWQRVLRLQDWDVKCDFVHRSTFEDNRPAEIIIQKRSKAARIRIGWPNEFSQDFCGWSKRQNMDWESHLVHELIHLTVNEWCVSEGSAEEDEQEQAINLLAAALISLEREKGEVLGDGD